MEIGEIKELVTLIDHSTLTEFHLQGQGVTLSMSKNKGGMVQPAQSVAELPSPQPQAQVVSVVQEIKEEPKPSAAPEKKPGTEVKAPIVGTFYAGPGGGKDNFVRLGQKVKTGDTLCILEAMKIMNEISSPVDGEVVEICVENEEMVEYGKVLFRIL